MNKFIALALFGVIAVSAIPMDKNVQTLAEVDSAPVATMEQVQIANANNSMDADVEDLTHDVALLETSITSCACGGRGCVCCQRRNHPKLYAAWRTTVMAAYTPYRNGRKAADAAFWKAAEAKSGATIANKRCVCCYRSKYP